MSPGNDLSELLNQGIRSFQAGEMDSAARYLDQALALDPAHADANHLRAVLLINQGRDLETAGRLLQAALRSRPGEVVYRNTHGSLLWRQGRLAEARDCFESIVAETPGYVDALYNLGNVLRTLGDMERARDVLEQVMDIQPGNGEACNTLGLLYMGLGDYHEAAQQFSRALELQPFRYELHLNLANAYHSAGEADVALLEIQNAIAIDPGRLEAYNNLGTMCFDDDRHEEAIESFQKALEIDPDSVFANYNLGLACHEAERYEQAVGAFEQVLRQLPRQATALLNLGNSLYKLGRLDEAVDAFRRVIALRPGYKEGHLNLGHAWRRMGKLDRAIDSYQQALTLQPDSPGIHFAKALAHLKRGEFGAGWRHYEWRFEIHKRDKKKLLNLTTPQWSGEDLDGKSLLVVGEQGLGDIVHFARYLPMLEAMGARIEFVCAPSLIRLMRSMECVSEFTDRNQVWSMRGDYHVQLLSLPWLFNTTLETIPGECPYLDVEERDVLPWRHRMRESTLNVGIAWCGNPDQLENRDRSCPLEHFAPLAALDGVSLYSLQKGYGSEQIESSGFADRIIDHTDLLSDYYDTACLMKALDLVITIDTSVAHVAGALGVPVWCLLWYAHCWRYLQDRDDSPWYPSMRLFRQPAIGDWPSAVGQATEAVALLAAEKRSRSGERSPLRGH